MQVKAVLLQRFVILNLKQNQNKRLQQWIYFCTLHSLDLTYFVKHRQMHTQKTTAKNEVIIEGPLLFQFHWLHGKKFFLEIFCFSFHEHLMLMSSFTSRSTSIEYDLNTNRLRTAIALVFFSFICIIQRF